MKLKIYGFKLFILLLFYSLCSLNLVFAQEDISQHPDCPYCGMDRAKFAHSRVYILYDDSTTVGTCSLHCAAIDLALKIDKTPKTIQVGDYNSKNLIDCEKAYWVINGDKMGVMTARAKWAFGSKADADVYMEKNGGRPAVFDDALQATFEDMYKDIQMIRKKRKMKRMRMKNASK